MKSYLSTLLTKAILQLQVNGNIPQNQAIEVHLERARGSQYGDFACNAALVLAKVADLAPRDLAAHIIEQIPKTEFIAKMEVAGPGFINIFLKPQAYYQVIGDILTQKQTYGQSQMGQGQSVIIEFVSANPTGPLHVGHGRGAAYGAALAQLLKTTGFKVHCEYYVNDAGRQMDILATSIWLRYLALCGENLTFPSNGYQGDYIWDIAASLHREQNDILRHQTDVVFHHIPPDVDQGGDKEHHIDALIARCKQLLGETAYQQVLQRGLNILTEEIRRDLEQFGVVYDEWFSEQNLIKNHTVQRAIAQLKSAGHLYEQEGALWFRSTRFGDEKDRVIVRENGQFTYFASDIAYHLNKLERGFDYLINIWGADHHGYVTRVKAALTALGAKADQLTVLLVQFATLYRGSERLQMSTRSGEFITLRQLRQEVGRDAARFFYIQRKSEQHLNFDLKLAQSQSNDNPVYYIQYAHARISSVFRQLQEQNQVWSFDDNLTLLERLDSEQERNVLMTLSRFPEVIETAARTYEPYQIIYYLMDLAKYFHHFYDNQRILIDDEDLRSARLSLIAAIQQVLRNGLTIIGVSAPEVM